MVLDLPHPLVGTVPQVVSPMRFTEAPLQYDRAPPMLGEQSDEILREIGFDDRDIASLRGARRHLMQTRGMGTNRT